MFFYKVADTVCEYHHDSDGNNDGGDHNFDVFGHADSGDNTIKTKHNIEDHDLDNDALKSCNGNVSLFDFFRTFEFVVDFVD